MSGDLAILLARLAIGLGFAAHGAQKLFGAFGGYGIAGTGAYFESIGFRPGKLQAFAAGFNEFFGGLLLAFGLFGPVGPALMAATMVVAIFAIHIKHGFFTSNNGYEVPLLYMAAAIGLVFAGYGGYSLDALLGIAHVFTAPVDYAVVGLGILGGLGAMATKRKVPAAEATAS